MPEINEDMLDIDRDRLDLEWMEQPRLAFRCAEQAAKAQEAYDRAKSNLESVEADLYLTIRQSPAHYELGEKPTEAMVKNTVLIMDEYKEALEKVRKARYSKDLADGISTAVDHRKKALEKLVDLHLTSYHSEPRASTDTSREYVRGSGRKRVNDKIKRSMK